MARVKHNIQTGANLHEPKPHKTSHVDGTDDIQNAGASQKGLVSTEAQTFAGVKTFNSFPISPSAAPTTDYQVANKKYVDDAGAGGAGKTILELLPGSFILPNSDFARIEKIDRTNSGPDNVLKFLADAGVGNDEYTTRPKVLPNFYQGGSLTIVVNSLVPSAELGTKIARFYLLVNAIAHGETWDAVFTSIGYVDINPTGTANQLLVDTIAWTSNLPTAGDMLKFKAYMDRSASDFIVGDKESHLLSIRIEEN